MTIGLSNREFARREGVSETLVRRARQQGRLPILEDGTIDPAALGSPWRRGAQDRAAGAPQDAQPARDPETGEIIPFAEAQRRKEVALAKLREQEFAQKAGRLGDMEEVHAAVFELAREDRDALLVWPSRVAAPMAAELGVDAVVLTTVLERYVREHLSERAEPRLRLAR